GAFINQGTISPDVAGGSFTLYDSGWQNQGSILVGANETVSFQDSWSNTGSITVNGGTLNLGGSFTTAGSGIFAPAPPGNFSRAGGTVNVTGTLDNTGSSMTLDARTGSWNLISGTVQNGTITTADGTSLLSSSFNGGGTLSGVTFNGTLDVANNLSGTQFARVNFVNGMTLNGQILVGDASGSI